MARTSQIIPGYLHPHVATYINDNTIFTDTVAQSTGGVRFISVFASPKGRDGVLLPMTSLSDYISEFGNPNYAKYGQPGYMPTAMLSQTNAAVWCMRVMPPDSRYSNAILVARVKDGNLSAIPPEPMQVMYELHQKDATINSEADLLAAMAEYEDEDGTVDPTTNPDGWKSFPIMGFMSKGRGKYGNNTSFIIRPDLQADKETVGTVNAMKNYRFEFYDTEITQTLTTSYTGSLDMNAVYNNASVYIEDLINDPDTGSSRVEVFMNPVSIEKIYGLYATMTAGRANAITSMKLFPFFESVSEKVDEATTQVVYQIVLESANPAYNPVDVGRVSGLPLLGGIDGTFDAEDGPTKETAMATAYSAAFKGETDKRILSKRAIPAEFILDANYPASVKTDLAALILKREDAYGILDAGIITTTTEAIAWSESMKNLSSFFFGKTAQHYKIRDTYTGKIIPVTTNYLYASRIANHFAFPGNQVPFVGKNYTALSGHVKYSMLPDIDADDLETKEILYTNKVNYFETIAENSYVRGTQGTAYPVWSDLSEENNVLVMLEMKRKLEDMVQQRIYSFAEADDRRKFTEAANRMFNDYRGTKVREFDVTFEMNAWEEERSILHCYLNITFRTMAKRAIIEIDINKRTS